VTRLPEQNPSVVAIARKIDGLRSQGLGLDHCPVRKIMDQIAAKWTVLILMELSQGPKRFNHLLRAVPDISRRMLTQGLRDLERNGILSRSIYDTRPPSVEYRLTPLGEQMMTPLLGLIEWISESSPSIFQAQSEFDLAQTEESSFSQVAWPRSLT